MILESINTLLKNDWKFENDQSTLVILKYETSLKFKTDGGIQIGLSSPKETCIKHTFLEPEDVKAILSLHSLEPFTIAIIATKIYEEASRELNAYMRDLHFKLRYSLDGVTNYIHEYNIIHVKSDDGVVLVLEIIQHSCEKTLGMFTLTGGFTVNPNLGQVYFDTNTLKMLGEISERIKSLYSGYKAIKNIQ
jgi:hypothetical protein